MQLLYNSVFHSLLCALSFFIPLKVHLIQFPFLRKGIRRDAYLCFAPYIYIYIYTTLNRGTTPCSTKPLSPVNKSALYTIANANIPFSRRSLSRQTHPIPSKKKKTKKKINPHLPPLYCTYRVRYINFLLSLYFLILLSLFCLSLHQSLDFRPLFPSC